MSQAYRELLGSDLLGDSYGYLNGSTRANRGNNSGSTEPTSPEPYMWWADVTTGLLKQRTGANDDWIIVGPLGSVGFGLLSRAGGVMSGSLDMGGQQIVNLGLGSGAGAARVQELDLKAPLASPLFTTDAQLNVDPPGNNSLIRRVWAEGRYVGIAGATMTGPLSLAANAAATMQAVPYQQLRDFTAFSLTVGHRHDGVTSRKNLGTDLDAAGSTSGQYLKSTGAGTAPAWTTIPTYTTADPIWGSVNGNATILGVGSGNWTVTDQGIGVYDINVTAGLLAAAPAMIVTANAVLSGPTVINVWASKQSADVVRVRTINNSGTALDCVFSFIFM